MWRATWCRSCARRATTRRSTSAGSPRASLALFRALRALAAIEGRDYVRPDDVKRLAPAVLSHRLVLSSQTQLRGRRADDLIDEILREVPVPVVDSRRAAAGG